MFAIYQAVSRLESIVSTHIPALRKKRKADLMDALVGDLKDTRTSYLILKLEQELQSRGLDGLDVESYKNILRLKRAGHEDLLHDFFTIFLSDHGGLFQADENNFSVLGAKKKNLADWMLRSLEKMTRKGNPDELAKIYFADVEEILRRNIRVHHWREGGTREDAYFPNQQIDPQEDIPLQFFRGTATELMNTIIDTEYLQLFLGAAAHAAYQDRYRLTWRKRFAVQLEQRLMANFSDDRIVPIRPFGTAETYAESLAMSFLHLLRWKGAAITDKQYEKIHQAEAEIKQKLGDMSWRYRQGGIRFFHRLIGTYQALEEKGLLEFREFVFAPLKPFQEDRYAHASLITEEIGRRSYFVMDFADRFSPHLNERWANEFYDFVEKILYGEQAWPTLYKGVVFDLVDHVHARGYSWEDTAVLCKKTLQLYGMSYKYCRIGGRYRTWMERSAISETIDAVLKLDRLGILEELLKVDGELIYLSAPDKRRYPNMHHALGTIAAETEQFISTAAAIPFRGDREPAAIFMDYLQRLSPLKKSGAVSIAGQARLLSQLADICTKGSLQQNAAYQQALAEHLEALRPHPALLSSSPEKTLHGLQEKYGATLAPQILQYALRTGIDLTASLEEYDAQRMPALARNLCNSLLTSVVHRIEAYSARIGEAAQNISYCSLDESEHFSQQMGSVFHHLSLQEFSQWLDLLDSFSERQSYVSAGDMANFAAYSALGLSLGFELRDLEQAIGPDVEISEVEHKISSVADYRRIVPGIQRRLFLSLHEADIPLGRSPAIHQLKQKLVAVAGYLMKSGICINPDNHLAVTLESITGGKTVGLMEINLVPSQEAANMGLDEAIMHAVESTDMRMIYKHIASPERYMTERIILEHFNQERHYLVDGRKIPFNVPKIYIYDDSSHTILMEYIEGMSLFDTFPIIEQLVHEQPEYKDTLLALKYALLERSLELLKIFQETFPLGHASLAQYEEASLIAEKLPASLAKLSTAQDDITLQDPQQVASFARLLGTRLDKECSVRYRDHNPRNLLLHYRVIADKLSSTYGMHFSSGDEFDQVRGVKEVLMTAARLCQHNGCNAMEIQKLFLDNLYNIDFESGNRSTHPYDDYLHLIGYKRVGRIPKEVCAELEEKLLLGHDDRESIEKTVPGITFYRLLRQGLLHNRWAHDPKRPSQMRSLFAKEASYNTTEALNALQMIIPEHQGAMDEPHPIGFAGIAAYLNSYCIGSRRALHTLQLLRRTA